MTTFTTPPSTANTDPNTPTDNLTVTTLTGADTDTDVGAHVTISLHQARQIGELLDVCDDLLRNGGAQVRTDLARSMLVCGIATLDWVWFIDMVGLSTRYLHARTARVAPVARPTTGQHAGQNLGQDVDQVVPEANPAIVVLPR